MRSSSGPCQTALLIFVRRTKTPNDNIHVYSPQR